MIFEYNLLRASLKRRIKMRQQLSEYTRSMDRIDDLPAVKTPVRDFAKSGITRFGTSKNFDAEIQTANSSDAQERAVPSGRSLSSAFDGGAQSGSKQCCGFPKIERSYPCCNANDEMLQSRWESIHEATFLILGLAREYKRNLEEESFQFRMQPYNKYGAIDLIAEQNSVFLLYLILYMLERPDFTDKNLLESFKTLEGMRDLLQAVKSNDILLYGPFVYHFWKVHHDDVSDVIESLSSELEKLIGFLLNRSYYRHISETKYNSYTAALVYGASARLRTTMSFNLAVDDREFERTARANPSLKMSGNLPGPKESKIAPVANVADDNGDEKNQKPAASQVPPPSANSFLAENVGANISNLALGLMTSDEEEDGVAVSDYWASLEKSLVCFVFQAMLYYGSLIVDNVQFNEDTQFSDGFQTMMTILIVTFSYMYSLNTATSEFYTNSLTVLYASSSWIERGIILKNFLINSVLTASITYATVNIITSSENFVDIVLNSVAIYFVADLDDLLVSEVDVEKLEYKLVDTYIWQFVAMNRKPANYRCSRFFMWECALIILISIASTTLYIISIAYYLIRSEEHFKSP